jgi:transcriptional regulator with XRE-family HTH domain
MPKSVHTRQYQCFCELITEARKKSGLTQADVAIKLGRPQSYVSKYENGERRLDVVEFLGIMRALEVKSSAVSRLLERVSQV